MSGGAWTEPVDVGVEAVPTTLLTNIADNLRCLHMGGGGQVPISTINAADSIDIGATDDVFIIDAQTNPDYVIYISTTGRSPRCKIWFINESGYSVFFTHDGPSPGAGYAKIKTASGSGVELYEEGIIGLIYSGTYWYVMTPS